MPTYDYALSVSSVAEMLQQNFTITGIARHFHVNRGTVYGVIRRSGVGDVSKFRISQKFNQDFFESVDSEEKAYWLGFLFADGCVFVKGSIFRVQINISSVDGNHLNKWHESIRSCHRVTRFGDAVRSVHHSKKMCDDLISLGCVPRKSLVLEFPTIDRGLVRHFIRGYFDGDGCISWHKNKNNHKGGMRLTFIGTESFLGSLQDILCREVRVRRKKLCSGDSRIYALHIGGYQESKRIATWMYDGASLSLERKKRKYDRLKKEMESSIGNI